MNDSLRALKRLLLNDLRLTLRELVVEKWRNGWSLGFALLFLAGLHLFVLLRLFLDKEPPSPATQTAVWLAAGGLMTLAALRQSLRQSTESSDLDLLLSTPVPSVSIIMARLIGTAVAAGIAGAVVLMPAINACLMLHGRQFAAGYLAWPLLALVISATTHGAVALIACLTGSMRSLQRSEAYFAIALTLAFFSLELRSLLPAPLASQVNEVIRSFLALPLLHLPAQAGTGRATSLAWLAVLGVGGTVVVARTIPTLHFKGRLHAVWATRSAQATRPFVFAARPWRGILRKELRLIARDPTLLSRTLPLTLYAFPLCFLAGRAFSASVTGVVAVYLTFVAIATSAQIARSISTTDEGWDLVAQSPASAHAMLLLRAVAAQVFPLTVALVVALVVALLGRPVLALGALLTAAICGLGASCIEVSGTGHPSRSGLIAGPRVADPITPMRIFAAVVFVLVGPVLVGLLAAGAPVIGLALLMLSTGSCVLVCACLPRRVT
jgi:ABC-2 type transport system permease protein